MKKIKSYVLIFTLIIVLILPSVYVNASGSIDPKKEVSLTLVFKDPVKGVPLTGVETDIFLIGRIRGTGNITVKEEFLSYPINFQAKNQEDWNKAAMVLEGYILRDGIKPTDSCKTDNNGRAVFPSKNKSLEQGLYLVMTRYHKQDGVYYSTPAFFLTLPGKDVNTGQWTYQVTAKPKIFFEEEKEITTIRKVIKIWDDEGNERKRPKEIKVQLLKDGKVYDTVLLNENNNWKYTWRDLEIGHHWCVVESELDQYDVEIRQEGYYFVIRNQYKPEEEPDGTTEEPDGTTEEPDGTTEEPDGTTEEPDGTTEEPDGTTEEPDGTTEEPDGTTEEPDGTTEENPKEEENVEKLPQTGQLWWPVPILLVLGMFFVLVGLIKRKRY